jgi:hypothetical protein
MSERASIRHGDLAAYNRAQCRRERTANVFVTGRTNRERTPSDLVPARNVL